MPCRGMAGPRPASRCSPHSLSFLPAARLGPCRVPLTPTPVCSAVPLQSAAANAKGPKGALSPGGFDDSTLPLVDKSLGKDGRVGVWEPIPELEWSLHPVHGQ